MIIIASMFGIFLAASSCPGFAADGAKFLADRHADKGMKCLMCHDQGGTTVKAGSDGREVCTQCHGWYDRVAEKTKPEDPDEQNPHAQHDGDLPCSTCHKGHGPGVNYCGSCHFFEFEVP